MNLMKLKSMQLLLTFAILFPFYVVGGEGKQIEIKVVDEGKPIQDVEVWLNYSDGKSSAGVTQKMRTDKNGIVRFSAAADSFYLSVPEINANHLGKAFKIPPDQKTFRIEVNPRRW